MTGEAKAHHAGIVGIYCEASPSSGTSPIEAQITDHDVDVFQPKTHAEALIEKFDWSKQITSRQFARLEQKVLAKVAEAHEIKRYNDMKQDRNSQIYADRQLRDYEEVRRLKQLSKKISEIQRFLRPIKMQ